MDIAKVRSDLRIDFPSNIKEWLRSESELAVFLEGNTLVLKKMTIPRLSSFAENSAADEMPMEEIVQEVHRHRKERK
ncbi:MAG: hypothetical protein ACE5I1_05385 [bacterium]